MPTYQPQIKFRLKSSFFCILKPSDAYKPPTPGGFSLNSVTSFNVDDVANRNEERLRRLEMIQRGAAGQGGRTSLAGDPDQVLQRFMVERRYVDLELK